MLPLRLLLLALLAACSSIGPGIGPDGDLYLTGVVAEVTAARVLVEPSPANPAACGIWASVDGDTAVYRKDADGDLARLGTRAVEVGDRVEVYVTGPIAESCPVQGRASAFVIVGAA